LEELPERICVKTLAGKEKCWGREEYLELYNRAMDDLELLGLVAREHGNVQVNVSELGRRLMPCFTFVRAVTTWFGTFEWFREEARKNLWGTTCLAYAYCLYFELRVKAMDYGLPPQPLPLDWDEEQLDYLTMLMSILQVMLEYVFQKEEVAKLFRVVFEI